MDDDSPLHFDFIAQINWTVEGSIGGNFHPVSGPHTTADVIPQVDVVYPALQYVGGGFYIGPYIADIAPVSIRNVTKKRHALAQQSGEHILRKIVDLIGLYQV